MFEFVQHYSYLGLFLILFAEESGVPFPIPGDIFIATVAAFPKSNYLAVVSVVTIATLFGSTILFTLSRTLGNKLLEKYGRFIKLTPKRVKKVEKWFQKYGPAAIVVGRLIPGLRIVTPFVAGLFKVNYKTFWAYTALAAFIWANMYYFIGKFSGEILTNIVR